jgi:hypothetical protein
MNRTQLQQLAQALSMFDYAKGRESEALTEEAEKAAVVRSYDAKIEQVIRKGIGDLDFDPAYFLGTEQTSPEGWAKK